MTQATLNNDTNVSCTIYGKKAVDMLDTADKTAYGANKYVLAALVLAHEQVQFSDNVTLMTFLELDAKQRARTNTFYDNIFSLVFGFANGKASKDNPSGWQARHYQAVKRVLPIACAVIKAGGWGNAIDLTNNHTLMLPNWLLGYESLEKDTLSKCEVAFSDMVNHAYKYLGINPKKETEGNRKRKEGQSSNGTDANTQETESTMGAVPVNKTPLFNAVTTVLESQEVRELTEHERKAFWRMAQMIVNVLDETSINDLRNADIDIETLYQRVA